MTIDTVIFDLDGTLVDSAADIAFAANAALAGEGLEPVTGEEAARLIGDGARKSVERAFALRGGPMDEDALDRGERAFVTAYVDPAQPVLGRLYPGVGETLARLAAAGLRLGVCTNKPQAATDRTLAALGVRERFRVLVGGDRTPFRKPDPRHLLACLEPLGSRPASAAMVGDSTNDEEAARGAGALFVGVGYGYGRPCGAAPLLERFSDLPRALGL